MIERLAGFFLNHIFSGDRGHRLRARYQDLERQHLLKSLKHCGEGVMIQMPIMIAGAGGVRIGNGVSLAAYIHIWGSAGVNIGDHAMIGANTTISSLTHDPDAKVMIETVVEGEVNIGRHVWIGASCAILPGVTIGDGAVVGAGSVVNKDVGENEIVAGVPAKFMRLRNLKDI